MTKQQNELCGKTGCHKQAHVAIVYIKHPENNMVFCAGHHIEYIGFMSQFVYKSKSGKVNQKFLDGIALGSK